MISWLSVIPKVLLAGAITLMDELYYKLAVWLNDQGLLLHISLSNINLLVLAENYREQSKYDNHLIGKVALFQFVNSFLSLFYIAFYLRDQEKLKEVIIIIYELGNGLMKHLYLCIAISRFAYIEANYWQSSGIRFALHNGAMANGHAEF